MRISDWSSDVCSSDLHSRILRLRECISLLGKGGGGGEPKGCCRTDQQCSEVRGHHVSPYMDGLNVFRPVQTDPSALLGGGRKGSSRYCRNAPNCRPSCPPCTSPPWPGRAAHRSEADRKST